MHAVLSKLVYRMFAQKEKDYSPWKMVHIEG